MQIADLCGIHSGHTARGRLEPAPEGGVPTIQLRDLDVEGAGLSSSLPRFALGTFSERCLVRGGEVIFRSRGEPNIAVEIAQALAEPAAVIVPLFILRPDVARVLPGYLAWAINQPAAQRSLGAEAQGTGLRMVSISALGRLDIPVPDLETQRRIVEADALAKREARLLCQLAARREQLFSLILGDAARHAAQQETL
jgi:restriction endonuclease S subunit